MCYTLIQFECCFQSFRYARWISENTVNDRLSAAALISFSMLKVRRLFQLRVKHKGEYRENSELGKKKDKYAHLELLYEPGFESFRTLKL